MGNLEFKKEILSSLYEKLDKVSEMVKEHISWAIDRQLDRKNAKKNNFIWSFHNPIRNFMALP